MNRDTSNLLFKLALVAGGAYAVYWFLTGGLQRIASGAAQALTDAGGAVGGKLFEIFHPNAAGEWLFYTVTFPNGTRHAIPSSQVDKQGIFTYTLPPFAPGKRWQIVYDKTNKKFAHPV